MNTTNPTSPSRHDRVTITCPVCQHPYTPSGRRKFCSDACRAAAYRRRRNTTPAPPVVVPRGQPRPPITVYECDTCGNRALGEQRCPDCSTFMRKIGLGGHCPACDQPTAANELLDHHPITT